MPICTVTVILVEFWCTLFLLFPGPERGCGSSYVAHNSIDKRGNNPDPCVHWQPIWSVFIWCFRYWNPSQDLEKFKALRIVVRIGSGVDNIDVKVSWCSILSVLPVIVLLALYNEAPHILHYLSTITYSSGCRGNGYCCVQCARLWCRGGNRRHHRLLIVNGNSEWNGVPSCLTIFLNLFLGGWHNPLFDPEPLPPHLLAGQHGESP